LPLVPEQIVWPNGKRARRWNRSGKRRELERKI
jgi:hypothetical protein